jgi:hypothetical protein
VFLQPLSIRRVPIVVIVVRDILSREVGVFDETGETRGHVITSFTDAITVVLPL